MGEIKNPATSEVGHQVTGKVAILYGTVKAISPDGTVRILQLNSLVFADDRIITGDDGSISIVFDTPTHIQLDLGRVSDVVIDEDVYGVVSPGVSAEASAEKEAIQKALLAGDQPLELDATAAGIEASSGGGHPVFVVTPDWSEVTPESGAETQGITWGLAEAQTYDANQENSIPTITVDTGNEGSGNIGDGADVVSESGLATGSHADDNTEFAYGTFTVSDPDGLADIQSITINGTTIPIGSLQGAVIHGTNGDLTITSYNSTTGVAEYTYELKTPATDGPGTEADVFQLTISDGTDTSAPATITFEIDDDVPTAVIDNNIILENTTTIEGNVLANDLPGADTPATFVSWNSTAATYGTFIDTGNGTYTYVLDNANPAVHGLAAGQSLTENLSYTMQDADGDQSTTILTITIEGTNDQKVSIAVDPAAVAEDGTTNLTYTVTLDHPSTTATVVNYTLGGTATPGTDYASVTGTLTIAAGSTTGTIVVDPTDDITYEGNETVVVTLTDATTGTTPLTITTPTATGTITDLSDLPKVSIAVDPAAVAEDGTTNLTYTVTLDHPSTTATVVNYTLGGTATPGTDYAPVTGTLTIAAGSTTGTIVVDPTADTIFEGDETVVVTLTDATTGTTPLTITTPTATGTITEDTPKITVDPGNGGGDDVVHESGLATGSHPVDTTEFAKGTFTLSDPDGLADIHNVTINGTTVLIGDLGHNNVIDGTYGTLTITSYNSTTGVAEYTYELTKPYDTTPHANNGATTEDNGESFTLTVSDLEGNSAAATMNFDIVDDIPTASDQNVVLDASTSVGANLLIILDNSGSMAENSGVDGMTRLDLAKNAIEQLINEYGGDGDVMVRIVTFNTTADDVGEHWMTANDAITALDSITSGGNTNYDAALATAIEAFHDPGAIPGGQFVSYFLSDGEPNEPSFWWDHSDVGIDSGEQAVWEHFLAEHDITSYALGMGTDVNAAAIAPIAYDGLNEVQIDPIVVTDLSQLNDVLLDTVVESSIEGNLITGSPDVSFGADGPADVKIVSIAHDANGDGIIDSNEVYTKPASGDTLSIATHEGGTLEMNFSTGDYTYTAPTGTLLEPEVFKYTIADGDGDMATANLTITTADDGNFNLVVGRNVDDHFGQIIDHYIDHDHPHDGSITGSIGQDILVGDTGGSALAGKNLNLILMLDSSGSMRESIMFNGVSMSRMEALKLSVINQLTDLANGPADHVRVQIVDFDTNASQKGIFDLKDGELQAAINAVNSLQQGGGTNYEAGLSTALLWANSIGLHAPYAGPNVVNQAIFISDGEPTYYYDGNGTTVVGPGSSFSQTALDHILNVSGDNDTVSEVQLLEAKGFTIEAVGINVTPTNLDHLNQVEGESANSNPDVATNITTGDELNHVLTDLTQDTVTARAGDDNILGGAGDDIIFGDSVNTDALSTTRPDGAGWQVFVDLGWSEEEIANYINNNHAALSAESGRLGGNDLIHGGSGNDIIYGQEGNDAIDGDSGNDMLSGGTGHNILAGGTGADTFVVSQGGHDTILDYHKTEGDKVDLKTVWKSGAGDNAEVSENADHTVKLQIFDSSHVEKASVTFADIHYSDLNDQGAGNELDSLLGKVTIDHS